MRQGTRYEIQMRCNSCMTSLVPFLPQITIFVYQLMVFDVNNRQMDQIPALHSGENSAPGESDCGIHTIEINPSR